MVKNIEILTILVQKFLKEGFLFINQILSKRLQFEYKYTYIHI